MEFTRVGDIPEADREALLEGLRGYNRQYIDKSGWGPVGVFCRDCDVAGLTLCAHHQLEP